MSEKFETWAIVELFGHTKIAGKVAEQQIAGGTFLRVDVPDLEGRPCFTRFYGASAIYSITPTTRLIAQRAADAMQVQPFTVYGIVLPERQLAPPEVGLGAGEEKPHQERSSLGDLRDEGSCLTYDEVEEVPF